MLTLFTASVPLAVAGQLAVTGPAAQVSPGSIRLTSTQMFEVAERAFSAGNASFGERALQALAADPDPAVRAEARFRLARQFLLDGRQRDAAVLFRRILDDQPDATRVRLELAALLQQFGDETGALRELRAVRTSDLPPTVARFVDRLSASLQASKPFGVQVEFALAPDSNINRATRSDTLGTVFGDFEIDQDKKSGIGAALRGSANARTQLSDTVNLLARASGEANLYRDKDFNDILLELAIGPELMLGKTRLGAEAAVGQQWFGMEPYRRSMRLSGSATRPIDAVSQLRLDVGGRWTDNRINDLEDGRGLSVRARYERALSPQMLVAASVGADRFKARDDAYSTRGWTAGLTAYRQVGRMTLSLGAELGRLKADDRLALLPEAREDRMTRFHVGTVFRQLTVAGFAPMTRLVVERNKSSIAFYDYQRTRTEVGISRAF